MGAAMAVRFAEFQFVGIIGTMLVFLVMDLSYIMPILSWRNISRHELEIKPIPLLLVVHILSKWA